MVHLYPSTQEDQEIHTILHNLGVQGQYELSEMVSTASPPKKENFEFKSDSFKRKWCPFYVSTYAEMYLKPLKPEALMGPEGTHGIPLLHKSTAAPSNERLRLSSDQNDQPLTHLGLITDAQVSNMFLLPDSKSYPALPSNLGFRNICVCVFMQPRVLVNS